ncbi:MAG: 2-succinyl-5-enolpyruvyl-6-hydroxy-3-cyclohexene-1-carboxylic-acid synthase [Actinobacteria bacterium]|nr:2-succinyl-5-enolpyruvyl-6-hydroxy-3-cyclohexene-1-carboxylic-acid synthase [Actinomycetota bacterium]
MTAANPSHALALTVVDEFARHGLTDAVLAPGSRSAALAMALHDDPRVRVHVQIDERSAGFVALGLGKATGRPAVVLTTSGTATTNLHPAVVEAHQARVPLLALTADRPPELRHTAANQTIDQLKLFGDHVRWFVEVGIAEDRPGVDDYWRSTASRLWAEALGVRGPAGPVHANLTFREPLVALADVGHAPSAAFTQRLDGRGHARPWTVVARAARPAPQAAVEALAGRIADTERGLLVVGDTAAPPGPIVDLAHAAGWPLIAEPLSSARTGRYAISTAHALLDHPPFAAAHRPDLVVRIGRTVLSRTVEGHLGPDVPQVVFDPDGVWLDPRRVVGQLLVADPALACEALTAALAGARTSGWLEAWLRSERVARTTLDALLDGSASPSEPRTARDVAAAVPSGGTLVVASSRPVRDLDLAMAPRDGVRVLANRGASGIDGFVSTALGVALATAPAPTVALAGDLSLLHDANGLLLRAHAGEVDLPLVVVNNDGGGIFHFLPQARFPASFERVFATPHGLDLADLARLHRLAHTRITRADELTPALAAAAAAGGIHLIEVRTDREETVALHRRIHAEIAAALDRLP